MLKHPSGMMVMDNLWCSQHREVDSAPAPADYKGPDPSCVWLLASAAYGETEIN